MSGNSIFSVPVTLAETRQGVWSPSPWSWSAPPLWPSSYSTWFWIFSSVAMMSGNSLFSVLAKLGRIWTRGLIFVAVKLAGYCCTEIFFTRLPSVQPKGFRPKAERVFFRPGFRPKAWICRKTNFWPKEVILAEIGDFSLYYPLTALNFGRNFG